MIHEVFEGALPCSEPLMWASLSTKHQWEMRGVAMLLQNRYQRQRLYTGIALAKAGRMDVVWGETGGVKGQLWVLYPLLFILQGFQLFIGLLLLKTAFIEDESEWQMVVCGLHMIAMAWGNFVNTVTTSIAKAKIKPK